MRHSKHMFTPVRAWAAQSKIPVGTTAHHKTTLCHHMPCRNFTKNNQCFPKSRHTGTRCAREMFLKTTSECPVLKKKKTCSAISLEKSTCAWLKLQSPTHPFHTTAHKRGENMGLRQSAGMPSVFSATTGPTFDQPHSVEWC